MKVMDCENKVSISNISLMWVVTEDPNEQLASTSRLETTQQLREMGLCVTLICIGPSNQKIVRGVEVLCFPTVDIYFFRKLIFHLQVLCYIFMQKSPPEFILFHEDSIPWLLPLRLIRFIRRRVRPLLVVDTRSVDMSAEIKHGWNIKLRRLYLHLMILAANRWADGRTVITSRMATAIHIPSNRLWGIWPSGVNLKHFSHLQNTRQWPTPAMSIQLIYIGSFEPERRLMNLCLATQQANNEGMNFILMIVGSGPEREDLEKFATKTNGRVKVFPAVPYEHIPNILGQAHIGALPFPDNEKFQVSSPIKLFEYMASGLPILATRIHCHTDVIRNGKYVFWAEGAEVEDLIAALRIAWNNRVSLAQMGAESARAAQQFTWHESAKKLKNALEYGLVTDL